MYKEFPSHLHSSESRRRRGVFFGNSVISFTCMESYSQRTRVEFARPAWVEPGDGGRCWSVLGSRGRVVESMIGVEGPRPGQEDQDQSGRTA